MDGYGNTIVDGFMTSKQAERDAQGLLSPQEVVKCASNAMVGEVEVAQKQLQEQAEIAAIQRGRKLEARG